MHPYHDVTWVSFFTTFVQRLLQGFPDQIYSDEQQVLVLAMTGVTCALLGTFLTLRKNLMFANALSHTILLGIMVVYLLFFYPLAIPHLPLPYLLLASLVSSFMTFVCTQFLHQKLRVFQDASLGLTFTTLFSLGIILVNLFTKNAHLGVESVLGNPDSLDSQDVLLSFLMMVITLLTITVFYRPFHLTSFDPLFAHTLGIWPKMPQYMLMCLTSFVLVSGFKALGVIMILGFMTSPVIACKLYAPSVRHLLITTSLLNASVSVLAVALSRTCLNLYGIPLSTGGLCVSLLTIVSFVIYLYKKPHTA